MVDQQPLAAIAAATNVDWADKHILLAYQGHGIEELMTFDHLLLWTCHHHGDLFLEPITTKILKSKPTQCNSQNIHMHDVNYNFCPTQGLLSSMPVPSTS